MKQSLISTITLILVSFVFSFFPGWTRSIQPISQCDNGQLLFNSLIVFKQEEPDFSNAGRPGRQTSGESRSVC